MQCMGGLILLLKMAQIVQAKLSYRSPVLMHRSCRLDHSGFVQQFAFLIAAADDVHPICKIFQVNRIDLLCL